MSETGAIKRALEPVQRPARTNGHPFPEDGKKIKNAAASGAASGSEFPDNALSPNETSQADLFAGDTRAEATTPETSRSRDVAPLATEIELKLLVDADRLADFSNATVIVA